jgi:hypothetical protein
MKKKTHEQASLELKQLDMELLEEYRGRDYKHSIRCSCGEVSDMYFGNAVSGKGGCPKCFRTKIVVTEERKENISKALKGKFVGELNPNYGKKLSQEAKDRISKANFRGGAPKCSDCDKQLVRYDANLCQSCNTKGSRNPMYIEDRSLLKPEGARIGGTHQWRNSVINRDCACIICNSNGKLRAHHLQAYRDAKHLRLDVLNGVALCEAHHREFHKEFGYIGATREHFEEFYLNKLEEVA